MGKGGGCAYCIAASERAMEGGKEGRGDRGEWDAGVEALAWVGPVAGVYLVLEAKVAKCAAHGNRRDRGGRVVLTDHLRVSELDGRDSE